jgi:hypothetical protein
MVWKYRCGRVSHTEQEKEMGEAVRVNQAVAQVPIKSAWYSKINWFSVLTGVVGVGTWATGLLPPAQAAVVGAVTQTIQTVGTVVLKTWFTDTVTPSSVKR